MVPFARPGRRDIFACSLALLLSGCGYHAGGHADTLPRGIQTIAIPAFLSSSTRYRLTDLLPQEITREFRSRTRYTIVTDPQEADAVLTGHVGNTFIAPSAIDPGSGKATSVTVGVVVSTELVQRSTGRVLVNRPNSVFRQNYSIAVDPHQFFDESGPAFDRLSRDLARDIVSGILSDF